MMFNEQVAGITDEPKIVPPSKWHIFYYLKWYFVVRPKLMRAMNKAKAEAVDNILHSGLLKGHGPFCRCETCRRYSA